MIAGIMKVWNEIEIINDALDHIAELADVVIVWDDASDDGTTEAVMNHPGVTHMMGTDDRSGSRTVAQGRTLQILLKKAMEYNPDWILQMDADERIEALPPNFEDYDGVRMKLYDFYITEEDVHLPYTERQWLGPEFRSILMMYRPFPGMAYGEGDQREMWGVPKTHRILHSGYVKHYSKAVSEARWERLCEYYATTFPEPYTAKWENRRGKAIHTDMSDFDRPLIRWEDREKLGVRI